MAALDTPSTALSVKISGKLFLLAQLTVVLWGISMSRPLLVPICLSALLAFVLTPPVRALRRLRVPDPLAVTLTLMMLALPFFGVAYGIMNQIRSLLSEVPALSASLNSHLATWSKSPFMIRWHLTDYLNLQTVQSHLENRAGEGLRVALEGLSALVDASSTMFLVWIFAVLMVLMRCQLRQSAEKILSRSGDFRAAKLVDELTELVQKFLLARLLITVIVAALAAGILLAFRVHYSLLLGVLLGVLTLIPTVGFIVGMVPTFIVALVMGSTLLTVFGLFCAFMSLAFFEANYLTPKLVGGKLNINSLAAFIGLFAGGLVWGIWGMLLSIPMLGILRICMMLSPEMQPWAELLAEREDKGLLKRIRRQPQMEPIPLTH